MARSLDSLAEEALHLPPDQRMTLAHRLLTSIEPDGSVEIEVAWEAEIGRRIRKYDSGESQAIPASEVFAELARRLQK